MHQTYRKDLLLRAGLRFAGTVGGAALAMALLWIGAPPHVLAGFLILGVAPAAASAYWIGTVMSDGAFMVGVTLLVVLLPDLAGLSGLIAGKAGGSVLELALQRVACTLIGVVLLTAITLSLYAPPHRAEAPAPDTWAGGGHPAARAVLWHADGGCGDADYLCDDPVCAPDPRPILRGTAPGVVIGVLAAVVFLALTLPLRAQGEVLVPALIACGFLAAGAVLRAHPRTNDLGMDSNICFLLAAEVGT